MNNEFLYISSVCLLQVSGEAMLKWFSGEEAESGSVSADVPVSLPVDSDCNRGQVTRAGGAEVSRNQNCSITADKNSFPVMDQPKK